MEQVCLIRCEYSESIGFGHLIRCLAIASELRKRGCKVYILSSAGQPGTTGEASNDGVVDWLSTNEEAGTLNDAAKLISMARAVNATLIVLDFYNITESYQILLRDAGFCWMQFDGQASYPLWADWVLSISPAATLDKYLPLKRKTRTQLLLGPKYAILRPEFDAYQNKEKTISSVKKIVLSFGGGDDLGMTLFCLKVIDKLQWYGNVVAVIGQENPNKNQISNWVESCQHDRFCLSINEKNMARVLFESDLAVISGGMITFEAAFSGTPMMMVKVAENQKNNVEAWNRLEVGFDLGNAEQLSETKFSAELTMCIGDIAKRQRMSEKGKQLVDGFGVKRVAEYLLGDDTESG